MAKHERCEPCGKVRFTGRTVIGMALKAAKVYGASPRPYRCPRGNGWHLTSMPKNKPRTEVIGGQ